MLTIRLTGRAIHGTLHYMNIVANAYISVREYSFELSVKIENPT